MGRIVDYPEITTLSDGDYLIVDNAEGGTKKVSAQSVAGTVDPTPTESSTNAVSSGGVWTSLNDISEEFDGLRTDAYDVYPKGIVSDDIVQFETGADNVPLSDLTGYIYPMMSGSGMPSRTNIRTISGPDDINIYQRNKNLIEQITYQSEPETVYLGVQNSSDLTMFFKAGDYRITVNIVGGSTVVPYWAIGSTATHSEYMHLDNDTNVSIYVYDDEGISASDIESFQVEVGTDATDYVEFEGDITNVVLPTDRGTIYSGRVALTAGKVYIDTVIYERNSSTMNNTEDKPGWAYTGLQTYDVAIGTFDDVIYWPNGDVRCTNVNVGSTYSIEVANEDYSLILPRDVYNMSQSQWISAGVDIQILVKLNTPIEIDIDPVEVRSLYGFNTYYCNSGKTGIIFGMDLAKYISDKTTEVQKEEQAKIEKAFATDTASGAVATFTDGADAIPMKSVKVAIEPVQDLHGYDHPWPAGGGVNLAENMSPSLSDLRGITVNTAGDGTITINGTSEGTSYIRGYFHCPDQTATYTWAVFNSAASTDLEFSVRNSRYNPAGGWAPLRTANMTLTFTIDSGETAIYWMVAVKNGSTINNVALKPMIVSGSTAPTSYSPYSNICPISGWTGAQVVRTGVNVWDEEYQLGFYNARGVFVANTSGYFSSKNPIPVKPNSEYALCINGASNQTVYVPMYYRDGTFKTRLGYTLSDGVRIITVPEDVYFINFSTEAFYGTTYNHDIGINYPSTDHDYHPYTGNLYSITFPSEAGTVYGGELDVTNGVLTVDRAMVTLDGSSDERWTAPIAERPWMFQTKITDLKDGNATGLYAISDAFKTSADFWTTEGYGILTNRKTIRIGYPPANGDVSALTAYLANNPLTVVYRLEEPITYHLTPTEIKSLLGDNNIWADAGDTTVEYRADTKLYIDKKIAEVINAIS